MWYAGANRDETIFDDPHSFRIDRSPNPQLSFGVGEHFCLGANLARLTPGGASASEGSRVALATQISYRLIFRESGFDDLVEGHAVLGDGIAPDIAVWIAEHGGFVEVEVPDGTIG